MASPKLYAEIWKRPGHASFGKVIADVPVISCSGTAPVNGVGEGRITIPKSYDRLDEILKPDPTTPANAVSSLVRVFSENSATPIYEFIPAVFTGEQDKADPDIEIVGPAVGVIWGYARLEAWDWTGADSEYSRWPDWIWGGRNVLGALESVYLPAVTKLYRQDTVTAGTFTIGVSFNGGAIQNTSALAYNAVAITVHNALVALSNVDTIEVTGTGSSVDPWRIQTDTPEGEYVFSVNSGGLTGGLVVQDRETIGAIVPMGWTTSFNPVNNLSHGSVDVFRAEPLAAYTPVPACATTGWGIYFDAGAGDFPGIQKIVAVKPGGRYYAKIMARPIGGTFTARLVIRDLYENGIGVDPSYDSGTVLAADTWTQMYIPIVSMPVDVDRVIYRFASVSGSNAPPIVVACMELREGMPPTTWGDILTQLWLDATSDHAGRQVWQIGAGATNFLTLDFSASVDSAGAAWTHPEVSITLKRGQSYLRVLAEAQKQGYETRIVPNSVSTGTWKLQVYNTGTMGVNQTAISAGPSIQGGRDVSRRDLRRFLPPATDVAVEAGGQNIARSRSATAITALGRIEQYVPNQDLGSLVEAATAAAQGMAVNLQRSQSLSYVLSPTTLDPEPFVAYNAADTLYVLDPPDVPTRSARRIKSLGFAFTKTTTEYPIQLESDSFVGVQGIAQSVDFLLKEFKAIRERPDETTDALNYFPAGGTGTPTVVIAAYNATELSKGKADYVCTGTSDEGIFNIALGILSSSINAASGKVNGRIVLTEGDFYFGTTIILHIGVRVEGMGTAATFLHSKFSEASGTATNCNMFTVDHSIVTGSKQPISFSHMSLDGHKSIQSSGSPVGIYFEPNGLNSVSLDNLLVHDFRGYGLHFDRAARIVYIDKCRIYSNTLAGIGIGREGYFYVTNCQINSNTTYGIEAPGAVISLIGNDIFSNTLDGFSAGGILQLAGQAIIGNRIWSNRTGIVLDGYEATIEGNVIWGNTAGGIDVYGNNPMNIVGNNVYSNTTFGIQLNGGAGNRGGVCSGNVCELNGTYGINVQGSHWLVTGNHVTNNGRTTTNTYDGIRVTSGSYSNVMGNVIRQSASAPVQKYGINVLVAAVCTKVVGNDYGDPALYGTNAFADASTTTKKFWPADGFYGDNFTACGEETPPGPVEGGEDDVTAPAVPTGLTAAAGDTFIYLNWTSNTELDLASYKVYKATASGGPFTLLTTVDDSEYTDTGLVNGTPLWFKITAVDSSGNESSMTASVTATPAVPPAGVAPAVPTGLAVTSTGDTVVTLNWNDNTETDLANYKVYRATSSGGVYSLVGSPTVSNFTDTGLTNGTPYWWKVSAIDTGSNESAQSSSVTTTPTAGSGTVGRPTPTVVFNAGNLYSAAKVTAEPAGTVFGFEIDGGTGSGPRYENAAIPTKDNNEYVFDPGTVLDGNGTTPLAFLTDAATTGVKIWDCEWTDYTGQDGSGNNNDKGGGAIRLRDAWELIDCYGHHNKYSAFRIDGDDVVVTGGEYSYNGQYGFAGGNCDDCTVDGAELHHNGGISSLDIGGDTGGCKIVHSERFTFVNVEAHHNLATGTQGGNGLWTDINNKDTLYDSCNVHDNEGAGIFHEVSCGFEIRDCTLTNNGQDNSGSGIHPVKANIQISNSGGDGGWIHDNVITVTSGSLGFYGISLFNSNHFQWTAANVTKCCLGVRNVLVEDNTINMSGSQWKSAISITGNLPTSRHASQFCGQVAITASGSNNRIRNNAETLSGGANASTPYIRAGVRVSAAAWAGFGYT